MRSFAALLATYSLIACIPVYAYGYSGGDGALGGHANQEVDENFFAMVEDVRGLNGDQNHVSELPCKVVTKKVIDISMLTRDGRRKRLADANTRLISEGFARLNGVDGTIYSYKIEDVPVRAFYASSGETMFSFAGSDWVSVAKYLKTDSGVRFLLGANPIGIAELEYIERSRHERVCS